VTTRNNRVVLVRLTVAVVCLVTGTLVVRGAAASLNQTSQNLTPYRTCTITATPSTTAAVRDAHVLEASATTNFGTTTALDVSSANNANRRVHLWFNVALCSPSIPATATVRRATLRLYATTLAAACRTIAVFRVGANAWTEAGITWNNQPFGTTINNPALGSATSQFTVGTPVGCTNRVAGYVTGADVTADVAAYVAGTATNNGWMLRDTVEGSSPARTNTFSAKNLGTLAQAPQLVITYVTLP
jgi:hypothetical protein